MITFDLATSISAKATSSQNYLNVSSSYQFGHSLQTCIAQLLHFRRFSPTNNSGPRGEVDQPKKHEVSTESLAIKINWRISCWCVIVYTASSSIQSGESPRIFANSFYIKGKCIVPVLNI